MRPRTVEEAGRNEPPVRIHTLGAFWVERHGREVTPAEWRSRKARDLLKLLVCRRGRPVPREMLVDVLWAEEPAHEVSRRLSVTLSTLRAVLDPEKHFDPDWFVVANRSAAWVRTDHLSIDVETFMATAAAGGASLGEDPAEATSLLTAAEEAYTGDFLEEDPYEDWSAALREDARHTYIGVVRSLAQLASWEGDHDRAGRYLLRLLACDPYDERAHLALVRALADAGRHGDARRMYGTYCDRMLEIAVPAAPYPQRRSGGEGADPASRVA